MLNIKNMLEEDKLFNFMSGVQPWAQTELRKQAVKDLPKAIVVANGLVNYKFVGSSSNQDNRKGKEERITSSMG